MGRATGTGPGEITDDGCAVEVYRRLPHHGEAEIVHAVVRTRGSILDLGAGTGRIAGPLAKLGHDVVAVDFSAGMLEHAGRLPGVRTVLSSIADVRLDGRFDLVLLSAHLLNDPDESERTAVLSTARRHVADDGGVVLQRHPPGWAPEPTGGRIGEVETELRDIERPAPGLVSATVVYRVDGREWQQHFTTRVLDDDATHQALKAADLRFDRILTEDGTWVLARPGSSRRS